MELILIIGIIAVLAFFTLAGILTDTLEHWFCTETEPAIVPEPTPEQLFNKCCNCSHYCNCHCYKSYEQIVNCKGE